MVRYYDKERVLEVFGVPRPLEELGESIIRVPHRIEKIPVVYIRPEVLEFLRRHLVWRVRRERVDHAEEGPLHLLELVVRAQERVLVEYAPDAVVYALKIAEILP